MSGNLEERGGAETERSNGFNIFELCLLCYCVNIFLYSIIKYTMYHASGVEWSGVD
jgi:hypothetical protein